MVVVVVVEIVVAVLLVLPTSTINSSNSSNSSSASSSTSTEERYAHTLLSGNHFFIQGTRLPFGGGYVTFFSQKAIM